MANLGNQKIKDTYQLVLQTDASGNLQKLDGSSPNPFIINQNLRYLDGTTHPSGYVLTSDGSGNASWNAVAFSGDVYISGGSIEGNTIQLQASSGGTVSVPGLSWSSSTSGHISNSGLTGNVGIGTNTPNEKLTVVGDISGTTDLHIGRNITTTNNLTVNVDTLYGDSDTGNVGVGNLNPSHKLTISGNTFLSVMLAVGQTITGTKNDVRISFNGGATTLGLRVGMQLKIVDGDGITQTVVIKTVVSEFVIHLAAPFPGSDYSRSSYLYSTSNNTNQFAVYSGTNIAFQVSGDVVMSGSTDLLDIFASSGITNQDVYWSANTDGSITNSGNTDINTTGNGNFANLQVPAAGKIRFDDVIGSDDQYIQGNENNITIDGDAKVKLIANDVIEVGIATNDIKLTIDTSEGSISASGNLGISGTTSYIGAISGTGRVTAIGGFVGEVTGNASTATKIDSITNTDIVQLDDTQTLTNKTLTSPVFNTGISGTAFLDEDDMASNSATKVASQQSIKTYINQTRMDWMKTTGGVKLLASNNWIGFNRTTGGLDSSGFWNADIGGTSVANLYSYYGSYRNTMFTTPYGGRLKRFILQGVNTIATEEGEDWNIHLAKSPVVNDSDSISWAVVTGFTKTLPDDRDKRFIYDVVFAGDGISVSQFDTFILAFQGTNSTDTWVVFNVTLEFEYTLT